MVCLSVTRPISALFFIATLYRQLSDCASANITVQPVSINTTLNSTVVFSCEGAGDELTVRVNDEQASSYDVKKKGFRFSATTNDSSGITRAELQAVAYDDNNNTKVKCLAVTYEPRERVFSNTAKFMIQGLLNSVVDLNYTFINGSSCTDGEAPRNITVIIQCNETGVVLTENTKQLINITGSVPIPLNQKCNISISEAGSTYIQTVDITIPPIKTSSSSPSVTPTLAPTTPPKTSSSG
ncbi:PREDICTED: uncharacterized protein LOC109586249 [Amphimedon queenslandica]|uniref:Ig-like domain-containing protein n=1 Tax=Amphimedon queenslandica TaxID=400682 RepID=A0AAN0JMD6_AMPQE|nr:PREDICTED: uncharacterized protein LOC109586249 [Amphimedon queenslandica]|eukprot:XP_019857983.1 PREDICTED: uncharacterized protein LOC109586249 [Amphimedon queenslandica]